jgi:hypothetical protein
MHVAIDSEEGLLMNGCQQLAHRCLATPCLTNKQNWFIELKSFT